MGMIPLVGPSDDELIEALTEQDRLDALRSITQESQAGPNDHHGRYSSRFAFLVNVYDDGFITVDTGSSFEASFDNEDGGYVEDEVSEPHSALLDEILGSGPEWKQLKRLAKYLKKHHTRGPMD